MHDHGQIGSCLRTSAGYIASQYNVNITIASSYNVYVYTACVAPVSDDKLEPLAIEYHVIVRNPSNKANPSLNWSYTQNLRHVLSGLQSV